MFKSFHILRFRGIARCDIEGMKRVTLFTGKNNAGKTAVLEAMFIHTGNQNPNLIMMVNAVRGVNKVRIETFTGGDSPWASVFFGYNDSQPIKLSGEVRVKVDQYETDVVVISAVKTSSELSGLSSTIRSVPYTAEGLSAKVLKLDYQEGRRGKSSKHFMYYDNNQLVVHPQAPMAKHLSRFMSPYQRESADEFATQFARLQLSGHVDMLVESLREIEPRLKTLELVFTGEPMLHGDIGLVDRRLLPLALMGDGVTRITALVLAIASAKGGVVFVDDIDTGLHHSVMIGFWRTLLRASELFDVQVIATTHSDECLRAALAAAQASEKINDLSLIRLERKKDEVISFAYDAEDMSLAFSTGLEVR